jgi:UDP:flavonoid glycosyltransferase YjiC (YdhE family)
VSVVFYVSGHGFGHAVRQVAIIAALAARRPDLAVHVRTSAADWLFTRGLPPAVTVHSVITDTGAVQRGSLEVDVPGTIAAAAAFWEGIPARVAEESAFLRGCDARLVVSDIPALGIAAAAAAGVPAIGIANFTWDWIYEGYEEVRTLAPHLPGRLGEVYAMAAEGWRLPMSAGFETFPHTRDLPLVARVARHASEDARARLGLPAGRPLVLLSLGGFGAQGLDWRAAAHALDGVADLVATSYDAVAPAPNVHCVDEAAMYAAGLRYEDLVAAVDVVASKPGYGIISECAANGAALLYTSRGRFREYDVLVQEMPAYLDAAFLAQDAFVAGAWREAVEALLARPPRPRPASDGAEVAAGWLADRV